MPEKLNGPGKWQRARPVKTEWRWDTIRVAGEWVPIDEIDFWVRGQARDIRYDVCPQRRLIGHPE